MIKYLFLLLIPLMSFTSKAVSHEYHVCITEINLNTDSQRLEITMQLFIDDFEKALHIAKKKVKITDDLSEEKTWAVVQWYLESHFSIDINESTLMLTYLGTEWDNDLHSFYVYMEAEVTEDVTQFGLTNSVFLEVSDDQQNMHHLTIGTYKKSVLLVKDKEHASLLLSK